MFDIPDYSGDNIAQVEEPVKPLPSAHTFLREKLTNFRKFIEITLNDCPYKAHIINTCGDNVPITLFITYIDNVCIKYSKNIDRYVDDICSQNNIDLKKMKTEDIAKLKKYLNCFADVCQYLHL